MTRLVCMPCSATKLPWDGEIAAIERYDGPMWRTLRATLATIAVRDMPAVWFLSARYGFHPASMLIPDYDDRMTARRAAELLKLPTSNRQAFADAVQAATGVLFAGGLLYRSTMRQACRTLPRGVQVTDGAGIGYQREQLARWLTTGATS